MDLSTFIITYWKYILSALISGCFLVVNIIQFFRTKDKKKLNEAFSRLPDIIRSAEQIAAYYTWDSTTATTKANFKKATAESLLKNEFGEKFYKKYIGVLDSAIEDILNTPAKKGGTYVQKENEEK